MSGNRLLELMESADAIELRGEMVDDAYLRELGRFVHMYSRAESTIHFVFPPLTGISLEQSRVIKKDMTTSSVVVLLLGLVEESWLDTQERDEIKNCLGQFNVITGFRNKAIHRGASRLPDGTYQTTNYATMKSLEAFEISKFDLHYLQNAAIDLGRISIRLFDVIDKDNLSRDPVAQAALLSPWLCKPVQLDRPKQSHPRPRKSSPSRPKSSPRSA